MWWLVKCNVTLILWLVQTSQWQQMSLCTSVDTNVTFLHTGTYIMSPQMSHGTNVIVVKCNCDTNVIVALMSLWQQLSVCTSGGTNVLIPPLM
jgi:hypothetical protein